jgi:hypothetical protein
MPEAGSFSLEGFGPAAHKLRLNQEAATTARSDKHNHRPPGSESVAKTKTEYGQAQFEAVIKADLGEIAERIARNLQSMDAEELQRIAGLPQDGTSTTKRTRKGKRK